MNKDTIENVKNIVDVAASVATITAIIVGGFWTYRTFIEQRQDHPRLKLSLKVSHTRLSDQRTLLAVDEVLENPGPVLLRLRSGEIRVIQVLPLPDGQKQRITGNLQVTQSDVDPRGWPPLQYRPRTWGENEKVIEPGESDQIHNEFVIPSETKLVTIVSYIYNPYGNPKNIGWRATTMYDLQSPPSSDETSTKKTSPHRNAPRRAAKMLP